MTCTGTVKGSRIELDRPLPYSDGQRVTVTVEPEVCTPRGSPQAVLEALRQPPHLSKEDVDALEESIRAGELPSRDRRLFEEIE